MSNLTPEEEHYFFGEGQNENEGCGSLLVAVVFFVLLLALLALFS